MSLYPDNETTRGKDKGPSIYYEVPWKISDPLPLRVRAMIASQILERQLKITDLEQLKTGDESLSGIYSPDQNRIVLTDGQHDDAIADFQGIMKKQVKPKEDYFKYCIFELDLCKGAKGVIPQLEGRPFVVALIRDVGPYLPLDAKGLKDFSLLVGSPFIRFAKDGRAIGVPTKYYVF